MKENSMNAKDEKAIHRALGGALAEAARLAARHQGPLPSKNNRGIPLSPVQKPEKKGSKK